MKASAKKYQQALRRVGAWGPANPDIVPQDDPNSPLYRQFGALNTINDALDEAATAQSVQATQATLEATNEPALRATLRQELHGVTQMAQALGKTVPGIRILRMPPVGLANQRYVDAAKVLLGKAKTYEPVLVEHGLAHDFIAQLQAAVNALQAAIDTRGAARGSVVNATERVAQNIALGMQFVKMIDVTLTKALRNDPAKLAEWKSVKRVVGLPKKSPVATVIAESSAAQQPAVQLATEVKAA